MLGISFLILALSFSLMLNIVYFSKKKIDSIENKVFKILLISNTIGLMLEVVCYYAVRNLDTFGFFATFFFKIYLVYFWVWIVAITFYVALITININKESKEFLELIKRYKYALSIIFYSIIPFLLFLPLEPYYDGVNGYTFGPAVIFLFTISGILSLFWIYKLLKNYKFLAQKKYLPVYTLFILGGIGSFVQLYNPAILILTVVETLITFIMFFTIENPDLKMIEELNIAKAEAERANLAKTDFLSSMSHEIRTPLNAITGFSHALLDIEGLPTDAMHYANDIIKSSDTLLEIVGGVLDVSKIESDRMELAEVTYNPVEEFEDLARMAKSRLGEKPIIFNFKFAEDIPYQLLGDKVNMKKIVTNLLTNAVKYTYEGQILFSVKCINKDNLSTLIITVQDTGRGIKEEAISKLFTKFERLGMDRNTTTEGTGLGLAITKKLVELMNGKINVQSQYGVGSIFMAQIPQKICKQSKPLTDTQLLSTVEIRERARNIEIKIAGKKVLVVDDNTLNIKVAQISLKKLDLVIESVTSGEDCLKLINEGNTYDLILMDIMMPNMSGEETFKKLKEIPCFNTPVIALTADAIEGAKEKYLEQGFNSYIAKPFSPDEIKKELMEIFK